MLLHEFSLRHVLSDNWDPGPLAVSELLKSGDCRYI